MDELSGGCWRKIARTQDRSEGRGTIGGVVNRSGPDEFLAREQAFCGMPEMVT